MKPKAAYVHSDTAVNHRTSTGDALLLTHSAKSSMNFILNSCGDVSQPAHLLVVHWQISVLVTVFQKDAGMS